MGQVSLPKESVWAWIFTSPLFDHWDSQMGTAKLTVTGSTLSATLFDAEHPTLVMLVANGTISGNKVKLRATKPNSDYGSYELSGTISTRLVKGFVQYSAVQTIVLYDEFQHQLGFTRTVRP
jgi:hypothetical protein